jgi:hypothetical protein
LNELNDVVIFHDGLRNTADTIEKWQHEKTRTELKNYAIASKYVDLKMYKNNIGLTKNLFRVMYDLGESVRNVIIFEEDKLPTQNGIKFLNAQSTKFDSHFLLDTLPLAKFHEPKISSLNTLQTRGGNIVLGPSLFDTAKAIYLGSNKFESQFRENLKNYLSLFTHNRLALSAAMKSLTKIYDWGLTSKDRPDGLLGYTLFVIGGMKLTPGASESLDISDLSTLGKNVNTRNENSERICTKRTVIFNERELCENCEVLGIESRTSLSIVKSIKNSVKYRVKKAL